MKAKIKKGDVLVSTWGYDQTNVDFYRVTRVTKTMVEVEALETIKVEDPNGFMTYTATPGEGAGEWAGEKPFWRKVLNDTASDGSATWGIRLTSYSSARPWNGEPVRGSSYA